MWLSWNYLFPEQMKITVEQMKLTRFGFNDILEGGNNILTCNAGDNGLYVGGAGINGAFGRSINDLQEVNYLEYQIKQGLELSLIHI